MSAELGDLLRTLLADPSKLVALAPEQERALVTNLQALMGQNSSPMAAPMTPPAWTHDDLLTVDEASAMLRVSPRWLYRHARTLPFTRKLSPKVLRCSRAGIVRWLASRRT